ncbi:nucleoside deaminase [Diaphorobacter sp. HDW4B]|uniref:nucleoside deaminase n=1 Tax=Diaphorobacter sp. HDW4B TaxID=2714925 RepID=UPI001F0FA887|nr:nucleoside deaminase [Diaphorobacter sp. HDW4B]
MRQAVQLAHANRLRGGRPFGAVLTRGSEVLATGINDIIQSHDPSTHAEMQAIRAATQAQKNPSLAGCTIYASGHPCPMCLAALVMTGVEQVFFAFDNNDAAPYNLSSEGTYQRLRLSLNPPPLPIARVDTGITAAQLYGDAPWPEEDMK